MIDILNHQLNTFLNDLTAESQKDDAEQAKFDEYKARAATVLRSGGAWIWEEAKSNKDYDNTAQCSLENCIDFMQFYETGQLTTSNMMKAIFNACDGSKESKVAKCIAIDFMSDLVAKIEFEAWLDNVGSL